MRHEPGVRSATCTRWHDGSCEAAAAIRTKLVPVTWMQQCIMMIVMACFHLSDSTWYRLSRLSRTFTTVPTARFSIRFSKVYVKFCFLRVQAEPTSLQQKKMFHCLRGRDLNQGAMVCVQPLPDKLRHRHIQPGALEARVVGVTACAALPFFLFKSHESKRQIERTSALPPINFTLLIFFVQLQYACCIARLSREVLYRD